MKKGNLKLITLLSAIIFIMALLVGCGSDGGNSANTSNGNATAVAEIKNMTGEDLVKQNSDRKKDKVLIIDVRSPEEYQAGHIPNAINISIDEFEDRIGEIEDLKNFPIITYCNSGKKSGEAAEILVNNGFQDVTNAEGIKEFQYDLVHYDDVRGAAFQKFIDENTDIVLIDVRPEEQAIEEGMMEGAINIPADAMEASLEQLPKDKTIGLYCNSGTKSAKVAKQLEDLGYKNIINSIDGVKEYGFTLVK